MSIPHHVSNDPPADVSVPLTVVPMAGISVDGPCDVRVPDEVVGSDETVSADPIEYQHLSLPTAGTARVRYSQIQPLKPRRFPLQDDLP